MASQLEITNVALSLIGEDPIVSLVDNNKPAKSALTVFVPTVREILRHYTWNCAMARAELAEAITVPSFGWLHQYQTPSDCLRVWRVNGQAYASDWIVEGRSILTNLGSPIKINYVRDLTQDLTPVDDMLAGVISHKIALRIAPRINADKALLQILETQYQRALMQAMYIDGKESHAEYREQGDFDVWGR